MHNIADKAVKRSSNCINKGFAKSKATEKILKIRSCFKDNKIINKDESRHKFCNSRKFLKGIERRNDARNG